MSSLNSSERLYEAFTDIREGFIEEARKHKFMKAARVRKSRVYCTLAAALALVVGINLVWFAIGGDDSWVLMGFSGGRDNADMAQTPEADRLNDPLGNTAETRPESPAAHDTDPSDNDPDSSDNEHITLPSVPPNADIPSAPPNECEHAFSTQRRNCPDCAALFDRVCDFPDDVCVCCDCCEYCGTCDCENA
jgi:hypothetical protein